MKKYVLWVKTLILEMKNSFGRLNSRLDTEENMVELEDWSTECIPIERQKNT